MSTYLSKLNKKISLSKLNRGDNMKKKMDSSEKRCENFQNLT